jgi:hypothetical protein
MWLKIATPHHKAALCSMMVPAHISVCISAAQALRDVKEVHEAWDHKVSEAEAEAARAARAVPAVHVDAGHASHHMLARLIYVLLMLALVYFAHTLLVRMGTVPAALEL